MYYYKVFNLLVAAEFALPETQQITAPTEQAIDVTISFGEISFNLLSHPNTRNPGGIWYYCFPNSNINKFIFRALGIQMEVTNGKQIVVSPLTSDYSVEKLRTLTLGTAFGVIGMQRNFLPIHGSSIEINNSAFIITGTSGAGKSTLLEFFINRGFHYLSDDVSFISVEDNSPFVIPAYPQRKLASDAAAQLGCTVDDFILINEDGRDKYIIRSLEEWCSRKLPLVGVVEIIPRKKVPSPFPKINQLAGHDSLALVINNLYRRCFYTDVGIHPKTMKNILSITKCIHTYKAIRPINELSPIQLGQDILDLAIKPDNQKIC